MKKTVIITTVIAIFALIFLITTAIYISFKTIKPATEAINNGLEKHFAKIIYIPKGIPPPAYDFNETSYFWEMETPAGEVTGIIFRYTPAFEKEQNVIKATLEMPQNGDPSIFNKVMPAVIADKQSLESAKDPQKANLGASTSVGYQKISLLIKPETNQTIKIVWEFKKEDLDKELKSEYKKLSVYPISILKILYGLPHLTISLLAAG